uniref:unspecific monooxygenase n=1 Tax=Bombyx mandarina TaxID=7092 RepID=C1KJL7_BOMMA|nr:cytochrome P450 [Bombyx mandarina]
MVAMDRHETPRYNHQLYVYYITKRNHDYWKNKKVPFEKPYPILGNYGDYILLKNFFGNVTKRLCEKFPESPYVGTFYGTEPALVVQDPDLIRLILVKDFFYFHGREVCKYVDREITTQSIFFTYGDDWRVLRHSLTPLFTTSKMKNMFHLIKNCCRVFENVLEEKATVKSFEINSIIKYFIMDCVGACLFGVEINAMEKHSQNPIVKISKEIFPKSTTRGIINVLRGIWPSLFYALRLKLFPEVITMFFTDLLECAFKDRQRNLSQRQDFIDLFMKLRQIKYLVGDSIRIIKNGRVQKVNLGVTDELLIAQCVSFLGAAFETPSTTLSTTFYDLAKNPKYQKRAIESDDNYFASNMNEIEFDSRIDDAACRLLSDETLRLLPSLANLTREVMEDYTFPTGLKVEKGTRIHIPVYHLQRNPKYFPEPNKFDPRRFLPEAKQTIYPFTYMPFGEGHRMCIAMRFAKMQMLAGFATLLKKYEVAVDDTTPQELTIDPRIIVTTPIENIQLKLIARQHAL